MPTPHAPAAALPWRTGLAYGALALPLAFVSLPLYVTLPHHYATEAGAPLAALGMVLLATRGLDALVDPALGRWADRLFQRGLRAAWQAAAVGALALALAFAALWHPPRGPAAATLAWLGLTLLACTLAYSGVAILHQAWGTRWGGAPAWRAQVSAWREGATLLGVVLASALPAWLGLDGTSAVLAVALGAGLLGLGWLVRRPGAAALSTATAEHGAPDAPSRTTAASPWRDAAFRRLLAVFMLNGVASAIPATLLPFFVADRLQAAGLQPLLLLIYFGAAALGLPLWVRAVRRWGLSPTWRAGMAASVAAFACTPALGAGDKLNATVANMRFIKPLDVELVKQLAASHDALVTVEEGCIMGGAGAAVSEALAAAGIIKPVLHLGLPDRFIDHGDAAQLLAQCGLDADGIAQSITQRFGKDEPKLVVNNG